MPVALIIPAVHLVGPKVPACGESLEHVELGPAEGPLLMLAIVFSTEFGVEACRPFTDDEGAVAHLGQSVHVDVKVAGVLLPRLSVVLLGETAV